MIENNKKKKYYLSNDAVLRIVDRQYNNIFKKISNINDLTKSFKKEISPKIYYNDFEANQLDSYYNNYRFNTSRYKLICFYLI